jgi:hypothetical protein
MFARREDMIFAPAPVLLGVDMAPDLLSSSPMAGSIKVV